MRKSGLYQISVSERTLEVRTIESALKSWARNCTLDAKEKQVRWIIRCVLLAGMAMPFANEAAQLNCRFLKDLTVEDNSCSVDTTKSSRCSHTFAGTRVMANCVTDPNLKSFYCGITGGGLIWRWHDSHPGCQLWSITQRRRRTPLQCVLRDLARDNRSAQPSHPNSPKASTSITANRLNR